MSERQPNLFEIRAKKVLKYLKVEHRYGESYVLSKYSLNNILQLLCRAE